MGGGEINNLSKSHHANAFGATINVSVIPPDQSQQFLSKGERDELFGSVIRTNSIRQSANNAPAASAQQQQLLLHQQQQQQLQ